MFNATKANDTSHEQQTKIRQDNLIKKEKERLDNLILDEKEKEKEADKLFEKNKKMIEMIKKWNIMK